MQENHQEALDKMFPDGWLIFYVCSDSYARLAYFNPHKFTAIAAVNDLIIENRGESDYEQ